MANQIELNMAAMKASKKEISCLINQTRLRTRKALTHADYPFLISKNAPLPKKKPGIDMRKRSAIRDALRVDWEEQVLASPWDEKVVAVVKIGEEIFTWRPRKPYTKLLTASPAEIRAIRSSLVSTKTKVKIITGGTLATVVMPCANDLEAPLDRGLEEVKIELCSELASISVLERLSETEMEATKIPEMLRDCPEVLNDWRKTANGGWTSRPGEMECGVWKVNTSEHSQKLFNLSGERITEHPDLLFHGTTQAHVSNILNFGFDRSFNRVGLYGKGSYFGVSPRESLLYAKQEEHGIRTMLVCRVNVGVTTLDKGQGPPPLGTHTRVDSLRSPRIFVAYSDNQALVKYIVRFRTV